MARALAPAGRAQNGGVVSALVDLALGEGLIHATVLTERDGELLPQGRIARRREEVISCAGSSYAAGYTLEALNRGPWEGEERIGVVGLPCQVLALSRMKASPLEKRTPVDRVELVIGLFCTWALDYYPFMKFLKARFGDRQISKMDITPPPERFLHVTAGEERHVIPLDEVRSFIRPSCQVCLDMTGELSDLSVGTVEGEEGWNTVIIRSPKGEDLLRLAESKGVLETRKYPDHKWVHLKEASILKKRRALSALRASGENYLILSPKVTDEILREVGP
jgi:coenzyme F420 hydrogenase subunit beta